MKYILRLFVILIAASVFIPTVHAMEWKQAETVTIPKEQVIAGSLMTGGTTITVDGVVHGDVFCAGKTVTISGIVDGDVLCAAGDLTVSGVVKGDIRVAAQTLSVGGQVSKNATVLGQTVVINKSATMSGEVFVAGQSLKTNGNIGPLTGFTNEMDIGGEVHGDTTVYTNALLVGKDTRLFGALRYTSEKEATIADGAAVSGIVSHITPDTKKESDTRAPSSDTKPVQWPANAVSSVIFYLLLSLLTNALFAKKITQVSSVIERKWLVSMGVGLLACIALPFISLFLLVTIIGILIIPVPILAAVVATAFGRIVAAQILGKSVLEGFKVKSSGNLYVQSLVGIPILFSMFKAPFVGGLFSFISIILGLGAFILSYRKQSGRK